MPAGVELIGYRDLLRRVDRIPKALQAELRKQIEHEVAPLVGHMRSLAGSYGRKPAVAASTVAYAAERTGARVKAGGGGGLGSTLLMGAEFGGRKRPKRPYIGRRGGTRYVMMRRGTMQFLPHLGQRGYWFWPTARKDLKGINSRVRKLIREVCDGAR